MGQVQDGAVAVRVACAGVGAVPRRVGERLELERAHGRECAEQRDERGAARRRREERHAELEALYSLEGRVERVDRAVGEREVPQGGKRGPREGREEVVELELPDEREAAQRRCARVRVQVRVWARGREQADERVLGRVAVHVEDQVLDPARGVHHAFEDRLDVLGRALVLRARDGEGDGEAARTGALDVFRDLRGRSEAAWGAGRDLEGVPRVGGRGDGGGEELARRLQRRTRTGVIGDRDSAYTTDDFLGEKVEVQVRVKVGVEIGLGRIRQVASGRDWQRG